jgi:cardiolipin synthase
MIPSDDGSAIRVLLILVDVLAASAAAGHALLNKRDPRAAWGWILASILMPLVGPLLYYFLGINRAHWRAQHALGFSTAPVAPIAMTLSTVPGLLTPKQQEREELVRIGGAMSGRPLLPGNRVTPLFSGEQAYPAMLEAIAVARHSVWLSSYIFEGTGIGKQFARALSDAQARGVTVRVLLDGIGDLYYRPRGSALLRRHGVVVRLFQVPRRFPPLPHLNLRNHRKLLIVDGCRAFLGGMNIGDHHYAAARRGATLDLHFSVEGPVVRQFEQVFAADWRYAAAENLALAREDPPPSGTAFCRALTDGPNEELETIQLVLLGALATAHSRVHIMTPYFIPTPELAGALQATALRGVEVVMILPERSNLPWLDWATRHWLRPHLQREIRVFWRKPPFAHSKMFVVDDYYALIGSANLDSRSLRLNFEVMLEVYDPDLVAGLGQHFAEVRGESHELRLQELETLPLAVRLRNAACWLFSPYL